MRIAPKFVLGIKGALPHGHAVTPRQFGALLSQVDKCLKVIKPIIGAKKVVHVLSELRVGSAYAAISPVGTERAIANGCAQYRFLTKTIRQLQSGKAVDSRLSHSDILEFKKLAKPIESGATSLSLGGVVITEKYLVTINELIEDTYLSVGTVKGRLEKIDVHNKLEFTIYPPVAGYSVSCEIPRDLLAAAHDALEKSVMVTGNMEYHLDCPFPRKVKVQTLDILPPDAKLPTLYDLKDSMPNLTGRLTTNKFLDLIRDDQS